MIPFWIENGMDREQGGIMTCLDRDGSVYDDDKSVWFQGRFAWVAARAYLDFGAGDDCLAAAKSCVEFLREHCVDADGRMFFHVTRDGRPIRKRRYAFSEAFAAMAYAAYARASGSDEYAQLSIRTFNLFVEHMISPGRVPPKFCETRAMHSLAAPMIAIGAAQAIRKDIDFPGSNEMIAGWIDDIARHSINRDLEVLLENSGPEGTLIDHIDGRTINPGHSIEAAWFILQEAMHRQDRELVQLGTTILDWMLKRGWDDEFGGMVYFLDAKGLPVQEYWHDMKFWWPQNETIIATLLAYRLTRQERYLDWHRKVSEWTHAHFPDPEYGEWYGYLHRDGSVSNRAKGNIFKGPFHIPRMQMVCTATINEILEEGKAG